jgi:hypothetical protein
MIRPAGTSGTMTSTDSHAFMVDDESTPVAEALKMAHKRLSPVETKVNCAQGQWPRRFRALQSLA